MHSLCSCAITIVVEHSLTHLVIMPQLEPLRVVNPCLSPSRCARLPFLEVRLGVRRRLGLELAHAVRWLVELELDLAVPLAEGVEIGT